MLTEVPTCCIKGCDSYKYNGTNNFGYFFFPVHDEALMKKWLNQIGKPNWKPKYHQICTMHFAETDMDCHPNRIQPLLKPTSVPTIFPTRNVVTNNNNSGQNVTVQSDVTVITISEDENCNRPVLKSRSKPRILVPAKIRGRAQSQRYDLNPNKPEIISEIPQSRQSSALPRKLKKKLSKPEVLPEPVSKPDILIITKHKNISNGMSLPPRYPENKRPVLRITINKQYKDPSLQTSGASVETKMEQSSENNETNCADRVTERNDTTDDENLSRKSITIENSRTNRAVTYGLDPRTGEIVVTTKEIDESANRQERIRATRTKRKLESSTIRKVEPVIRKRSARSPRVKKNLEFISTSPKLRKIRNLRASTCLDSR